MKTYSPALGQDETNADSEFTLPCDLSTGGPFALLGETTAAMPAPSATLTCPSLRSATAYEWFVSVADGPRVQASPVWRFTTGYIGESNPPPTLAISLQITPAGELEFVWPSATRRTPAKR